MEKYAYEFSYTSPDYSAFSVYNYFSKCVFLLVGKEYISDIYQEVYHVPYFNLQVNIDNNVTDLLLIENNLYFRPCISLGFGQNNSIGTWLVKKSKILTKVEIHFLYIPYNPSTN